MMDENTIIGDTFKKGIRIVGLYDQGQYAKDISILDVYDENLCLSAFFMKDSLMVEADILNCLPERFPLKNIISEVASISRTNACISALVIPHQPNTEEGESVAQHYSEPIVAGAVFLPFDHMRWNFLQGLGNQSAHIRFVSSQLARLLSLMPVTANAVQAKLLALCHNSSDLPAITELVDIFVKLAKKDHRGSLLTASRNLGDLTSILGEWSHVRSGPFAMDARLTILPVKDVPPALEVFLLSLICKRITDMASAKGHTAGGLREIFISDEGRNFFGREREAAAGSGKPNLPVEMLTKMRSYGLGVVVGTQSISKIQSAVLDNCASTIFLRCNNDVEAKACCRRLGMDESRYMELINMEVGEAWVVSPQYRQPVKIKIPPLDLGDYPSTESVRRRMEPVWATMDAQTVFAPKEDKKADTLDFHELLGDSEESTVAKEEVHPVKEKPTSIPSASKVPVLSEYIELLHAASENADYSITQHFKSLGWSPRKITRVRDRLIAQGWAESVRISSSGAGRPKETLSVTQAGLEVLNAQG